MKKKIIFALLALGIIFRVFLTWDGRFIFNMDNGRDFVDVREMVELKKLRLTGPNTAVEGLYNGPAWYYLLSIPYILTDGDPYGAIIMEIILWAIGGFFLLKLVGEFNKWLIVPIGFVWVSSNYIVLTTLYSFNPTPVTLLTPVFVYSLVKYLQNNKGRWIILTFILAGAFFNLEMNIGVFLPLIIFLSLLLINKRLLKDKHFLLGAVIFIAFLMPQFLFDLRHEFLMSRSVLRFLSDSGNFGTNLFIKIKNISDTFYKVFEATLFNQKLLTFTLLILLMPILKVFLSKRTNNVIVLVSSLLIAIPFIGYLFIPVSVNPWHVGGPATAFLILVAFGLSAIWRFNFFGRLLTITLSFFLILSSIFNIINFFINDFGKQISDPSVFKNEIAAIDFVYQKAQGKNFKVYIYLPSIYDYPYQYLFWWYGKKTYGYVPGEYKYLPDKPPYVPSQEKFEGRKDNFSGLVFLIKEPDRNYTRPGWEGNFIDLKPVDKQMVGPIEIELRIKN